MDTEIIEIGTPARPAVTDITGHAAAFVSGRGDGLLSLFVPHATAGLAIIETGAGSDDDLIEAVEAITPHDDRYRHRHGSPGHGADHVIPAFLAPSLTVPVIEGRPALGTWQSIVLFDPNSDNTRRQIRFSFIPAQTE